MLHTRKLWSLLSVLMVLALLVAACAPAATPAPTQPPAPTTPPVPTKAPEATKAPEPTKAPLDEGSPLSREARAGRFMLPDDEIVERMYSTAIQYLEAAGLRQYEISNFCVPGRECRHNCNYWARGEYLGLGPGAWSFIGNTRSMNIADVNEYIARMTGGIPAVDTREVLNRDQSAAETLFLGLRRTAGIDLDHYGRMFGPDATKNLRKKIEKFDSSGLFQIENTRLSLTLRGFLLSNEALTSILP